MEIKKVEIVCEDGKTKIRLNDGEVLRRVLNVKFEHDANLGRPTLYLKIDNSHGGLALPIMHLLEGKKSTSANGIAEVEIKL